MNARLSPGLLAIALLVLTLYGPLSALRDITTDDLTSRGYWLDVATLAVGSFADAAIAIIGVVATAVGVPLLRPASKGGEPPVSGPDKPGPGG